VIGQVEQLLHQRLELRPIEARLAKEAEDLAAERTQAEEQAQAARDEVLNAETARRMADLDARAAVLNAERLRVEAEWVTICREFADTIVTPSEPFRGALRKMREDWDRRRKQDEEQCQAAGQWVTELEQALATFPDRLTRCVNVVAATPRALALDARFGDSVVPPVTFDLLIFEEADQITEADFLQAARRARRWVLVGEPQPDVEAMPPPRSNHGRTVRPNTLRPAVFQKLWRNLRWNPRRLPYVWEQRGSRLHCRLRPLAPEQECWVQTERLADRPDVELRILSRPRQEPELVEVVFPSSTTVPEAKEYLFRELGEVTLQAADADWHWTETPERVILQLTPVVDPNAVLVPLCAGVRELVAPTAGDENDESAEWRTCAVEFDRATGWDLDRVREWSAEHLQLRDLGRSILLTTHHRSCPVLAAWLSHLLRGDAVPSTSEAVETAFEFVTVPDCSGTGDRLPSSRGTPGRSREPSGTGVAVAPRSRPVKGGAGLEADLSDARRVDQMPADLRASLPPRGIVNYLEAQALIRHLEGLLADDAFRASAERWQQSQTLPCESHGDVCVSPRHQSGRPMHRPAVAVIALYPAQAELITRLLQRVPALLASPITVEVGQPATFRHRECLAALVSLTRSHTHRAVPYGEGQQALTLALTRAAERVIVFGDPGTLARRSHWQGALDHLDELAAERERALVGRIVRAIPDPEAIPPAPPRIEGRLREGNLA
jgi:hypothetical protein